MAAVERGWKMAAKAPPVLTENGNYTAWKHQLQAWELLTELKEEKKALAVYLQGLEGRYKEVVSKIDIQELNTKDGVAKITTLLDRYCQSQESQRQYSVYEKVHSFRRSRGENLNDALIRFESLVMDMDSLDMKLPPTVLAFHVLKAMALGQDAERLVRATVTDLTYENMVKQIRGVMETVSQDQPKVKSDEFEGFGEVKLEPEDPDTTLYSRGQYWPRRNRGFRRGRPGRNNFGRSGGARFANDRQCFVCGASDHLSYDCPNKFSNSSDSVGTGGASGSGGNGRCFKCNSPDHFAYACPSASNASGARVNPVKITLLEL